MRYDRGGKNRCIWQLNKEESRRRGRWPDFDIATHVLCSGVREEGRIETLGWMHGLDMIWERS